MRASKAGQAVARRTTQGGPDGADGASIWLPLMVEAIGPDVRAVVAKRLKRSANDSTVDRLRVETATGSLFLIAKQTVGAWDGDGTGPGREATFLRLLSSRLGIPQPRVYFAGPYSEGWLTLVEDVSADYAFSDAAHVWTAAELQPVLAAYAAFHANGRRALRELPDRGWLFPPYHEGVLATGAGLPGMVETLTAAGVWSPLPGFGLLVERTVRDLEDVTAGDTLLHNDVTPANAGLPTRGEGLALLVDWEMIGSGPAELDLAYMFMQPFDNTRKIDRAAALDRYWENRRLAEGSIPTAAARARAQRHADVLLALWLVPVAYERLLSPFPAGTAARAYWDAMSVVLEGRLRELSSV